MGTEAMTQTPETDELRVQIADIARKHGRVWENDANEIAADVVALLDRLTPAAAQQAAMPTRERAISTGVAALHRFYTEWDKKNERGKPSNDRDIVGAIVDALFPATQTGAESGRTTDHEPSPLNVEQLRELLRWRDDFIVRKGLWMEFVEQCDKRPGAPVSAEVEEIAKRHQEDSYSDGGLRISSTRAAHAAHADRTTLLKLLGKETEL